MPAFPGVRWLAQRLFRFFRPMNVPAEIFRTYDIRGVVGRTLTAALVREIGRALGSVGRARGAATFAIGRDGRLSGPELSDALMEGLTAAGADVVDIGMGPTPVAYFAAHHLGTGSCVAVSGSHNPPDYNGLKMVVGGDTLSGDEIQDLRQRIEHDRSGAGKGKRSTRGRARRLRRAHRRRREARAALPHRDRLRQRRRRHARAAPVPARSAAR